MGLIALEEHRMIAFRRDFVDLSVVPGGDVEISRLVEGEIPDVLGPGREINGTAPGGIQCGLGRVLGSVARGFGFSFRCIALICFLCRLVFDLVNLAVGSGRGVDHSVGTDLQRLHLQFLRLENDG